MTVYDPATLSFGWTRGFPQSVYCEDADGNLIMLQGYARFKALRYARKAQKRLDKLRA